MMKMKHLNNTPPPQRPQRYGALDGLRAYAAIGIVLMHVLSNIGVKLSDNYLTEVLIPWFTDLTLMFRVVERIHLERLIADGDVVYILTCGLVMMGAIVFSWFMKRYAIPRLVMKID